MKLGDLITLFSYGLGASAMVLLFGFNADAMTTLLVGLVLGFVHATVVERLSARRLPHSANRI